MPTKGLKELYLQQQAGGSSGLVVLVEMIISDVVSKIRQEPRIFPGLLFI